MTWLLIPYLGIGFAIMWWMTSPAPNDSRSWYSTICLGIPLMVFWPQLFVGYKLVQLTKPWTFK